jgi:ArsR family transcriptional regulator, arsenate/arsenite/antimonite-responsive transcriptional repressor
LNVSWRGRWGDARAKRRRTARCWTFSIYNALAQENRLAIFRYLVAAGPSGVAAGEIGKALGISATSLSFHLKELDRAGLVTQTRHGRFIYYALHVEGVRQLIEYLTEECCGGHPELCGATFTRAERLSKESENCHE